MKNKLFSRVGKFLGLKKHVPSSSSAGDILADKKTGIQIFVMSFGFKHGVPLEAEIMLDVRFLQNPYWVPELKEHSGLEEDVANYVKADPEYATAYENIKTMLLHQLELFRKSDRAKVIIAIGCTGGQHRSVAISEHISAMLKENGFANTLRHRNVKQYVAKKH